MPANFSVPKFSQPSANFGNATANVNLGNSFGALQGQIGFDKISATNIAERAKTAANIESIKGQVRGDAIGIMGDIKSNQILAKAREDAAREAASGSMFGSALGAIGSIGGALIGLSDASTKDNVQAIDDALETLRKLRPVTFNYKPEWSMLPERTHHGFIAQEYKEVMPDASYYDEEYQKHCIDTNDLIGLLVRAIQQLETRVARMEAETALVGVK